MPRGERWQLFRRRGLEVTETEADNLPRSARRHAGVDGERKFGEIEIRKCGKTILKKEIGTTDPTFRTSRVRSFMFSKTASNWFRKLLNLNAEAQRMLRAAEDL